MKINNDLIELIKQANQMNILAEQDQIEMENFKKLSASEKVELHDNFKDFIKKINDHADKMEQLIIKLAETESDEHVISLHSLMVKYIDCEDYEKCHEISQKIKNYNK